MATHVVVTPGSFPSRHAGALDFGVWRPQPGSGTTRLLRSDPAEETRLGDGPVGFCLEGNLPRVHSDICKSNLG